MVQIVSTAPVVVFTRLRVEEVAREEVGVIWQGATGMGGVWAGLQSLHLWQRRSDRAIKVRKNIGMND
jgi:hypothetical protein